MWTMIPEQHPHTDMSVAAASVKVLAVYLQRHIFDAQCCGLEAEKQEGVQ